ncbi:cytochrome b5 domain-containing protein [Flexistipes sinusarabici]|uniref:cytochrome b5 domain-containing protein n=1 Tax=Flexistipes sinusarabici TaxID=2352 RepID=UPI0003115D20|nr:cytochrome b5 domain-containing protein [Flexistipes sinusarabici]
MKRSEVKEYNGKNGKPAYIIFDNKIYDVTESKLWKDGIHMNRHKAGEDMTDFISMAPHGENLLERDNIRFVGNLEEDKQKEDKKLNIEDFTANCILTQYLFIFLWVYYISVLLCSFCTFLPVT